LGILGIKNMSSELKSELELKLRDLNSLEPLSAEEAEEVRRKLYVRDRVMGAERPPLQGSMVACQKRKEE
jgi:hypothetical protein